MRSAARKGTSFEFIKWQRFIRRMGLHNTIKFTMVSLWQWRCYCVCTERVFCLVLTTIIM